MNLPNELKSTKRNYLKSIVLTIVVVIVISAALWYLLSINFTQPENFVEQENSLTMGKYAGALKRLDKIKGLLNVELFNHPTFMILKSFVKLPLELGKQGKENPFQIPEAPEQLLLSPRP